MYKITEVLLKCFLIFSDGFMPPHLSEALKNKNLHNVHSILNKRVKPIPVDIRSKEFKTGLMYACSNKDPKMVEVFLKKGAKLELTDVDDGWTALHLASQSGCHESVKQLIDKGANIEAITNINETPLHLSVKNNNPEVVKQLIDKGANIEARTNVNETSLHLAAKSNCLDAAGLLIDKCANIEAKTDKEETALHLSVKHNSFEVLKLLIKKGADLEAKTNGNKTAIYLATTLNHVSIVECLAEKNCQMKQALAFAVHYNFVEVAKCLLFHLTRAKKLNEKELQDLLTRSAGKGHTKIANELLVNGANVNNPEGKL